MLEQAMKKTHSTKGSGVREIEIVKRADTNDLHLSTDKLQSPRIGRYKTANIKDISQLLIA